MKSIIAQPAPFSLAEWANTLLGMGRLALAQETQDAVLRDMVARIQSAPKTPLDAAAERLKALVPGHGWSWYRQEAMWIVSTHRTDRTRIERLVIEAWQQALTAAKHPQTEVM